jgi:hypothetical protein
MALQRRRDVMDGRPQDVVERGGARDLAAEVIDIGGAFVCRL